MKRKQAPRELTPLDVVGTEFIGMPVTTNMGKVDSVALQEIAWRPRAALFVAKKGLPILEGIIEDTDEKTQNRIKALELLMAYTYGKPAQKIEHTGAGGGPIQSVVTRLAGLGLEDLQTILEFDPNRKPGDDIISMEYIDIGGDENE